MNILTLPILLDVVVAAVLLLFAIMDGKRGLVLSLVGLAGVLIALAGAGFASRQLSPTVGAWLQPRISDSVEAAVTSVWGGEDHSAGRPEEQPIGSTEEGATLLEKLGMSDSLAADVLRGFSEQISDAGSATVGTLVTQISETIAAVLVFVAAFVLILIVLWIVGHALDLAFRLPVLRTLNHTGGALFGLAKGMFLLFLAMWLLNLWGNRTVLDAVAETKLLRWLSETNPVSLLRLIG